MKYRYSVNHNGVWYPAGAEVPKDTISVMDTTKEIETVEQDEPVEDAPVEAPVIEAPRTKTDINRMPKAMLLELAAAAGIDRVSEAMTVNEIKRKLFMHYGL